MTNNDVWKDPKAQQLARTVATITDTAIMQEFLRDVMTEKEIIEIGARLEAAKMLQEGRKYTEITTATNLSSRTIARISEWLQKNTGGYQSAIAIAKNLSSDHHTHIPPARAE